MINMFSCKKSTTADRCEGNPFTSIHPDIIQNHILNRLDAAVLASTSCASSQLCSLFSDGRMWRDICNSTWPSTADPCVVRAISTFPFGHRSFYSDSFLSASHQLPEETRLSGMSELIFAVYRVQVIYSKVLETRNTAYWSLKLPYIPLKLEGDCGRRVSLLEEHLRVSWIVIDPNNKRAVNVASHAAVEYWFVWPNCDFQLCYVTVATEATEELVSMAVLVTLSKEDREELLVTEVEMHVEDIDGNILGETESMEVLRAAMEGERRMDGKMEKHDSENFLRIKDQYTECLDIAN